MKHFHDITVTTDHTQEDPIIYEFNIDKGLITEAGVFFAPGCHGLVNAKIYFQTHQILPRNQEGWCRGNNGWWSGELYFPITASPLKIKVEAWADGTAYDHTITVCLELTPWEYVPAWERLIAVLTRLAQFMGVPTPKPQVKESTP